MRAIYFKAVSSLTMHSLSSFKPAAFRTPRLKSARDLFKQRLVAMSASRVVYVKGDPDNKVLGDCPFCHRVLITLQLKVRACVGA